MPITDLTQLRPLSPRMLLFCNNRPSRMQPFAYKRTQLQNIAAATAMVIDTGKSADLLRVLSRGPAPQSLWHAIAGA